MPEKNQNAGANPGRPARQKPPASIYDRAVSRAGDVLDVSLDGARDFGRRAAEGVEANPLVLLAGGIAVGVLAGLAAPRSERETELLAPVGKRLNEGVTAAVAAAKEAGREELGQFGLGQNATGSPITRLLEGALGSIGNAAAAAVKAPKN